jgi:Flp pilus assembly pilin Flp
MNKKYFLLKQSGASLVEYALLLGLLSVAVIFAVRSLGVSVKSRISNTSEQVNNAGR